MEKKLNIKNELIYIILITLLTFIFYYIVKIGELKLMIVVASLSSILLETWFFKTFMFYSGRKVSKYSDVIQRISLKQRFFSYFLLPLLFYISLLYFTFFTKTEVLVITVICIGMIMLFVLFLNVKSSLNKFYSIEASTRAVFDFICIVTFYIWLNVFIRLGLTMIEFSILSGIFAFLMLLADLKIHNKGSIQGLVITIVSAISIAFISFFATRFNIFIIPAIGSLAFYLVVALWNVRFSGKYSLGDYIPPILYTVLALILILNI